MQINKMIDVLVDISKQKEMALEKIFELTKEQEDFIRNTDLEGLKEAIGQKQTIIEKINQMDVDFLNSYNRLKKSLGVTSIEEIDAWKYPTLKELKLHISNIMVLLKKMEEIDQNNTKNLKVDFEKVKMDIKKLKAKKQSSKITSKYMNKYTGAQGIFIDHK